jgi:hypothetical protein
MGRYAEQIQRYIDCFGRDRVLVLFYEDLRDHPDTLWRRCCEFLEMDGAERPPQAHRQNRSGIPRSRLVYALLRSERFKRSMKRLLPTGLAAWAKHQADGVNLRRFPPMSDAIYRSLSREFEDDIRRLMAMTDRDLSHWLPDD